MLEATSPSCGSNALIARQQQASGVLAAPELRAHSGLRTHTNRTSVGNTSGVASGAPRRFPRGSTFQLSRHFATGSASLTNVSIDEAKIPRRWRCRGLCNCCCADSLIGPGSFMDSRYSTNACDAARTFCESEFHYSNCSALRI